MGGGGFMHDGYKKIQQNRNKLNRSSLFDRDKLMGPKKGRTYLEDSEISEEEMRDVLNKISLKNEIEKNKTMVKLVISLIIVIAITLYIFL